MSSVRWSWRRCRYCFFYGLVRIPIAEAIAISFIAPLIALYFAAIMLGEKIRPSAVIASLLGVAGVIVIGWARFGQGEISRDATTGVAAILVSAVLYALNLVLQRRQALLADPIEIAMMQNVIVAVLFLLVAPWLAQWPSVSALQDIGAGAVLAVLAILFLSWGYARAEAQALVPIEYTGFLWAALFGWIFFSEEVGPATVAGALLIVIWLLDCRSQAYRTDRALGRPPNPLTSRRGTRIGCATFFRIRNAASTPDDTIHCEASQHRETYL